MMCIHSREYETCRFGCTLRKKEELKLSLDKAELAKVKAVADRVDAENKNFKQLEGDLMAQVKSKDTLYKQSLRKIKELRAELEKLKEDIEFTKKDIEFTIDYLPECPDKARRFLVGILKANILFKKGAIV